MQKYDCPFIKGKDAPDIAKICYYSPEEVKRGSGSSEEGVPDFHFGFSMRYTRVWERDISRVALHIATLACVAQPMRL
jgi:hypothetical protein